MFNLTPVVRNLIIINVVVFIGQKIIPGVTEALVLWDVNTINFRPYQLFTYMFCHGSFSHIFWNLLIFAFMAPILEEYWGQKRFLLFYIIAGIGAGVFNILMVLLAGLGKFDVMLGASGAVYGVMTAFGVIFPDMQVRPFFFLPVSFKAKYIVMVLGGIAIYLGFTGANDGTAHLAHLGGIVVAIILLQFWRGRGS